MKKWVLRIALVAALLGLGIWGWRKFFPNHEQLIRKRLAEVAEAASFAPNQPPFSSLKDVQKLASFCTPDVEITVNVRGASEEKVTGRDDLRQKALAVRAFAGGLKVEFLSDAVKGEKLSRE